jgi:hypothetical protein
MRLGTTAVAAVATFLTLGATPASASEASTIIERCAKAQSLSGFSQKGYREALKQMPTVGSEYSDCTPLIREAELAATAGGGGAGIGGARESEGAISNTPIPLTPVEQQEVLRAHHRGSAPVLIGDKPIEPGVVHANVASTASTLPTSLLTALGLLLGAALLLAAGEALKRVRAGRNR